MKYLAEHVEEHQGVRPEGGAVMYLVYFYNDDGTPHHAIRAIIKDHADLENHIVEHLNPSVVKLGDETYFDKRAPEFGAKPIGDQMDAVIKGFMQLKEQGIQLHPETEALVNWSLDIKARNKKPGEK